MSEKLEPVAKVMDLSIDKDWFMRKAAEEGDLEIGAGTRKTMTLHLTPDEIAALEKLVNPEAAKLREELSSATAALAEKDARIAELEANINLKADFIEATIEQLAAAEAEAARLRGLLEEARKVLEPMAKAPYVGPNAFSRGTLSDSDFRAARSIHSRIKEKGE